MAFLLGEDMQLWRIFCQNYCSFARKIKILFDLPIITELFFDLS